MQRAARGIARDVKEKLGEEAVRTTQLLSGLSLALRQQ